LTVTLEHGPSGWRGTADVPSHYALQYQLLNLRVDSATVGFALPDVLPPAVFDGRLERGRIQGRFTSALGTDTLRGTFELWRRPPAAVPYTAEPARFRNGDLELAATVFHPRTPGPHPGVVFVHGSGPQTRDSYLRWFADRFARAGFVTLIYDKRGTGESGGDRWPQTSGAFTNLADDALAGVRFLGDQPDVDANRIGIWGLSQGAWIGPLAAAQAPGLVRFLIMLSGGGVSPAEQELYDDDAKLRGLGFDETSVASALAYLRLADQYVRTGTDEDWRGFALARDEARSKPWYPHLDRFPQILPREAPVWSGLRTDLDYDPAPVLARARVPVLLILGEEDRSTPARETALRVQRALDRGGNPSVTVRLLPGADHALMVKPTPRAPWLTERPANNWVSGMIEWTRGLR
jgi:pimeloyl-ACP methyl ester carboxylesterase